MVAQPVSQLLYAERLNLRRRKLDRQRHAVELTHQAGHQRLHLRGKHEIRIDSPGPVGEQIQRLGFGAGAIRAVRIVMVMAGHRQWRQPVPSLAGDSDRLAAGREHPQVVGRPQDRRAEPGNRLGQMLAIIEHQQHLLAGERRRERVGGRNARRLRHAERSRHQRGHLARIADRRELHQPYPVGEAPCHLRRHLGGQPRLTHPARPDHRHHAVLSEHRG